MDRHQRLKVILENLEQKKTLEVADVGQLLNISPATVRRDFNYLAEHYDVDKTWGGISVSSKMIGDTMIPVQQRRTTNIIAKKAIAKKAASLVKSGEIIFIDGGTTTLEMIPYLTDRNIKIITNSILITQQVDILNSNFVWEVFLMGGLLYPNSGLVVGPQALDSIQGFNADWTFLSVGGITADGATNSNVLVVETEKAMIKQSAKTVILADSSKFGKKDLVKICDLEDVDFLITEVAAEIHKTMGLPSGKIDVIYA